jgi:Arc/MetJ-type ribon-helix-helix transcriptional regulator
MADMVKAKVASGEYASESEVVQDGLLILLDHDAAIEKWVVEEVVPTLKDVEAGKVELLPLEEVRSRLHARLDRMLTGQR